jgi:cyclophilin family peptidyl-prolyl cis-trans isomerase
MPDNQTAVPTAAPAQLRFTRLAALLSIATLCGGCASLRERFGGDDLSAGEAATDVPDPSRHRGSPDSDTAVLRFAFNGAERPVVVQLDSASAPKTVANFKDKILSGYYEGTAVHRVIPRYIIQAGDPLTRNEGNREDWGTGGANETVPAEIKLTHGRGSLAMARLTTDNPAKASSASQFYFSLGSHPELDGEYTVFGTVTQGMDVLDTISRTVVDSNDNPLRRIEITSTSLVPQNAVIDDPGQNRGVGGRTNTVPDTRKSALTRFIERVW